MNAPESPFVKLASVNVNERIEKKGNLSYLSWAWAWDYLQRHDPESSFEYPEPKTFGDTVMVYCTVTAFGKARTAHLPVMNHMNKPIANPDAFQVNTAMQRCLVKAIALHGLGLYIYAGEDLPASDNPVADAVVRANAKPMSGAKDNLTAEQIRKVDQVASKVTDWLESGSVEDAVMEKENAALEADETVYFWTLFDSKQKTAMKKEYDKLHKHVATQA